LRKNPGNSHENFTKAIFPGIHGNFPMGIPGGFGGKVQFCSAELKYQQHTVGQLVWVSGCQQTLRRGHQKTLEAPI